MKTGTYVITTFFGKAGRINTVSQTTVCGATSAQEALGSAIETVAANIPGESIIVPEAGLDAFVAGPFDEKEIEA